MPELKQLDEELVMQGAPARVSHGGATVNLTRKIALIHALETNDKAKPGQKAMAYDLSVRLGKSNGSITVTPDEAIILKEAILNRWQMPVLGVPLERWLNEASNSPGE